MPAEAALTDKTHQKGPQINQHVSFILEKDQAAGSGEYRGRITHVGLSEVTASFLTKAGPFTATFANDWLKPAEASHEWTVRAQVAPIDAHP
jgi:hypothetical protein